jgi:hypothetical protein
VQTDNYYKYYAFIVTKTFATGSDYYLCIPELKYYGYEEDPPLGDTSVDTTFTSIMNTPQTTGANVYVDGNLGGSFTNRVTGPDVTGTSATYDNTNKYWEMNGQLTSNIAVEANTFLEGDAPHSVSVWFNSSNLEANVSNTCVFSISDQEKLDSVNLDLQSNTWHNLTYAYQGEGGSRVTYLDGRKVAEDQAEDTFGDYPPFAMTGYSQGGYVVSVSSEGGAQTGGDFRRGWHVFDNKTDASGSFPHTVWQTFYTNTFSSDGTIHPSNTTKGTFVADGTTYIGEWLKLEMPQRLNIAYVYIASAAYTSLITSRRPRKGAILGSNDNVSWHRLKSFNNDLSWTTVTVAEGGSTTQIVSDYNTDKFYKYFLFVIEESENAGNVDINEIKIYGHRENDLVRLPDPTNVLKYPHIAMTGPVQRGYKVTVSTTYSPRNQREGWMAFNDSLSVPGGHWQQNESTNKYTNGTGLPTNDCAVFPPGGTTKGEWIKLELTHKIKVSSIFLITSNGDEGIEKAILYGSNNDSDWDVVKPEFTTTLTTINGKKHATESVTTSNYYKYLVLQVTRTVHAGGGGRSLQIYRLQYFGVEEGSVPIQIGGGNIDKVANFRVYDKFVGEDQALEIWDAQKDEFGRAKSSMTLQKGRLGIGTDEPQGRLAVLDEPHNLEEFPPRAMQSSKVSINAETDYYDTHFEGHGTFTAYGSHQYVQPNDARVAWKSFSKQTGGNSTNFGYMNSGNHYSSGGNIYTGPESNGGKSGDFLGLKFPYKVKITHFFMMSYVTPTSSRGPKEGYLLGRINGGDWQQVHFFQNKIFEASEYTKFEFENDTFYDEYILVVTKTTGATVWNASELRYFGTREQGQSVLHDGQLTLTKNLTVPRIGPALDADDTPRRDRLVVEYNTSTNPTFEGAVRDTSGRGFDGCLKGGAYYDATEKALKFDGTGDYTEVQLPRHQVKGDWIHSVSCWVKGNVINGEETVWNIGDMSQNPSGVLGSASTLAFNSSSPTLRWYFYSNDSSTNIITIKQGEWNHIVLVYKGGTSSDTTKLLYVNGAKVLLNSISGTASPLNFDESRERVLMLGRLPWGTNSDLNGSISNFKLYDVALTPEEAKTLYDMGRCDEGHHVVNFSKTRVGIGLGDGEAPRGVLDVRGDIYGGCPVYFHARKTSGTTATTSGALIAWNLVDLSRGGGYDSSNGKFTAPIKGVYKFIYYARGDGTNNNFQLRPRYNSVDPGTGNTAGTTMGNEDGAHASAYLIHEMNEGDTLEILLYTLSGTMYISSYYNGFYGYYLSSL